MSPPFRKKRGKTMDDRQLMIDDRQSITNKTEQHKINIEYRSTITSHNQS